MILFFGKSKNFWRYSYSQTYVYKLMKHSLAGYQIMSIFAAMYFKIKTAEIMKRFFLSVMIVGVIFGITACKKDNNNSNSNGKQIPTELIQTWKSVSVDGNAMITDKIIVLQIKDNESANVMERLVYDTIPVWQTMSSMILYSNDTLKIYGGIDYPFTRVVWTYKILEVTTNRLKMQLLSEVVNNSLKPDNMGKEFVFEPAPSSVEAKIGGMWKTTTPSIDPFGMYFKTMNDYDYYYYDSQGASTIKTNHDGHYWFYDNFIVLRYKNAPDTDDQKEYVECWNVKIVETTDPDNPKTMTLSAIREDGTPKTISFRFIGIGI
jgi:hypothetical protein